MKSYYVQILAIVLCSCSIVIQDALSASTTNAGKKPVAEQRMRRLSSSKTQVPPPVEYENLKRVGDMFWSTWEKVNENEFGKLGTRSVQNAMTDILTNSEFWEMLEYVVKRHAKMTHDKKRAKTKIHTCNKITDGLINPLMPINEFKSELITFYDTISQYKCEFLENILRTATDVIESVDVIQYLDTALDKAKDVELNPKKLSGVFTLIKRSLNYGGKIKVNGRMGSNLNKISSMLNRQNSGKLQRTSSRPNDDLTLA